MTIMPHNPFSWLFPKSRLAKSSATKLSKSSPTNPAADNDPPCCSNIVHIAYRGVSDDRLYLASNRKWQEVKFFRPKGLRVFCKACRRRIY